MNSISWNYQHKCLMLASFVASLMWSEVSQGRGFRVMKLPDRGGNWGCGSCHVNPFGGGALHSFGIDYERLALPAGDEYTAELGQTDSDGDGFSNDEEFNAQPPTEPWNSDSHPPEVSQQMVFSGSTAVIWAWFKVWQTNKHGAGALGYKMAIATFSSSVEMDIGSIGESRRSDVQDNHSEVKLQEMLPKMNRKSKGPKPVRKIPEFIVK